LGHGAQNDNRKQFLPVARSIGGKPLIASLAPKQFATTWVNARSLDGHSLARLGAIERLDLTFLVDSTQFLAYSALDSLDDPNKVIEILEKV